MTAGAVCKQLSFVSRHFHREEENVFLLRPVQSRISINESKFHTHINLLQSNQLFHTEMTAFSRGLRRQIAAMLQCFDQTIFNWSLMWNFSCRSFPYLFWHKKKLICKWAKPQVIRLINRSSMINLMENSTKVELPSAVEYSYSITTAINVGGYPESPIQDQMKKGNDTQNQIDFHNFASIRPMRANMMVMGSATTQYDQKIVWDMRRSNAPDATCVICVKERAGGEARRRTFATMKIGLSTKWSEPLYRKWMLTLQTRHGNHISRKMWWAALVQYEWGPFWRGQW